MSGLQKNVASQKWLVFAFDRTNNTPKTGDAANITGKIRQDYGTANAITDTNPAEIEDGYYEFDLSQAETNGDVLDILPESSTSDVQVIGVPGRIFTVAPNFSSMGIESDGDLTKVNTLDGHTAQTGDNFARIGANGVSLSAIPWNAAWDTEVQSECNDALVAVGLDHLISASVTGTDIADDSIIAKLVSKESTADWDDFVNTTDSLQAIRDHIGDGTNLTEAGGDGDHLTAIATSVLTTQFTESYAADGTAPTLTQAMMLALQTLTEFAISGTTYTIKKLDGSTTAATLTLDDATNPTSATRAT